MVATQNDAFRLPDFEELLWDELRGLHEQEREQGLGRQGRRAGHPRRPRRATYLAAVAMLAVVVGVTAVVLAARQDDRAETPREPQQPTTQPTGPQPPLPPPAPTGPPPQAGVDAIEVYQQSLGDDTFIQIHDEATGSFRTVMQAADGSVTQEQAWVGSGPTDPEAVYTTVHHHRRQYTEEQIAFGTPPATTRRLVMDVGSGLVEPDGTEVLDGVELMRFVHRGQALCAMVPEQVCEDGGAPDDRVVWVDPATIRPVRDRQGDRAGTYWYLLRTPENVALTELVIPDGYERVEVEELSGEVSETPPSG